jgi:phosphomannomutase
MNSSNPISLTNLIDSPIDSVSSPKDPQTISLSRSKKIVAFDLDGTLTESKQPLDASMGILIAKLLDTYHVAVISGGSIEQFRKQFLPFLPILPAFPLMNLDHNLERVQSQPKPQPHSLFLLPVSGSQRYEYDSTSDAWIETDKIEFPKQIKEKAMRTLREFESVEFENIENATAVNSTNTVTDAANAENTARATTAPGAANSNSYGPRIEERGTQITFSALGQDAPLDLKTAWDPDLQKRRKIQQYLEKLLPEVDVHIGGSTSIDILPKGFSKAVGLKRLLSKIALTDADAVFVGDAVYQGGNDYSVFEAGILTVAVKNSEETADFIASLI